MIEEIAPLQLQEILQNKQDIQLLDVREDWEYQQVHLAPAIHIPLGQLPQRWTELDPNKRTIAYCHHGMRSYNAAMFLNNQGFENIQNLSGGIDAYSVEADPELVRY